MLGSSKNIVIVAICCLLTSCGFSSGNAPGITATTTPSESIPDGPITFSKIYAGETHSCGILDDGSAVCWGDNTTGQLGNNSIADSFTPVIVSGGHTWEKLALGREHTCGLTTGGQIKCWGDGGVGQLGNVDYSSSLVPTSLASLNSDFIDLSSGALHACALRSGGTALCWGFNSSGQLGNNTTGAPEASPVTPSFLTDGVAISSGNAHTCVTRSGGGVLCWGDGASNQFGISSTADVDQPTGMPNLTAVTGMSLGNNHACAFDGGTLECFGRNNAGQLGDTSTTHRDPTVNVAGGQTYTQVAAGGAHTCAIRTAGTVDCWGTSDGAVLGSGSGNTSTPVAMTSTETYTLISAGVNHNCGITTDGVAKCWGNSDNGELGNGSTTQTSTPTAVSGQ